MFDTAVKECYDECTAIKQDILLIFWRIFS